ncbi:MAG: hypothetical protein WCN98_19165 [Verrucomicrobiaceae bacterium]
MKHLTLPSLLTACLLQSAVAGGFGPGPWANGAYYPGQLDGRYSANVYNDNVGNSQTTSSTTNSNLVTNTFTTTVITNIGGLSVTSTITTNGVTTALTTNEKISPTVVSGVLGFGIKNGTPSVTTSSNAASATAGTEVSSSSSLQSIGLEPSYNYFLIYVNGDTFVGTTAANINPNSETVSGALVNGSGRPSYQLFTNQTASTFAVANTGVEVISLPSATASGYFNANVKKNKSPYTFKGDGTLAISSSGGSPGNEGFYDFNVDGIKSGN